MKLSRMERETGFEPATSTLARSHSTTELFPLAEEHLSVTEGSRKRQESGLNASLAQDFRGFFGGDGVSEHAAAPFLAAIPGDPRQDFEVPVKTAIRLARQRPRMQHEVIGRPLERPLDSGHHLSDTQRQRFE